MRCSHFFLHQPLRLPDICASLIGKRGAFGVAQCSFLAAFWGFVIHLRRLLGRLPKGRSSEETYAELSALISPFSKMMPLGGHEIRCSVRRVEHSLRHSILRHGGHENGLLRASRTDSLPGARNPGTRRRVGRSRKAERNRQGWNMHLLNLSLDGARIL